MVLVDLKREAELKAQGIKNIWQYGNTEASMIRYTPEIKLNGLLVGTNGGLFVPSQPARATLRMHQGYFHAYGHQMEDLADLGFFCMRLGIEGDRVLINMFENTRREFDKKMQILNGNYQVLNSRIFKGRVSHAVDTRYEYNNQLGEVIGRAGINSRDLQDLSPKSLSALFDIEPVEKAKELLIEGFKLLTHNVPVVVNLGYHDKYPNAFFYTINQQRLLIQAKPEYEEAFAAAGGSDWRVQRNERR